MNYIEDIKRLYTWQIRLLLYLFSLSTLLFSQNYCTNICPFIDGLKSQNLIMNLGLIFIFHIFTREMLLLFFSKSWKNISPPRQGYYLSIISWLLAGVAAFALHAFKYPSFPIGSHIKLLSSYWILGAGVLAQMEYILFEKQFSATLIKNKIAFYNENISRRVLESFLIFSLAPVVTILLIVGRYQSEGFLNSNVSFELFAIGTLLVAAATIVGVMFGRHLKKDTETILEAIGKIKSGEYDTNINISRADELGEIAEAISHMSTSIRDKSHEILLLNKEIVNTQKEVISTMGAIGESRSKETGGHVKRVADYSKLFALKIGVSEERAELLKLASPMHDIGKVAIPDSILKKPGKLTDMEYETMKSHAQLGYDMLKYSNREILKTASIVAYEHHERYDGKGYPNGVKGENIHIYGRITALADVFDALGSDRVYKKKWDDEKIFELLRLESGKQFDPKLIEIFFENIDEISNIRKKYKDSA